LSSNDYPLEDYKVH